MTKIYIAIIGIFVMIGIVVYSTIAYKDTQYHKHEVSYRNEINKLKKKNDILVVEKRETKVKKEFVEVEKKIDKKAAATKTYTVKKMEDKNVKYFDDSF